MLVIGLAFTLFASQGGAETVGASSNSHAVVTPNRIVKKHNSNDELSANLDTVHVAAGKLEPFWMVPKNKKKKSKLINIGAMEVMQKAVTVAQFKKFLEENPEWTKENVPSIFADEAYLKNLEVKTVIPEQPMTSVSWFAAKAYCEKSGMRLPTTNEWEYLAAASDKKKNASKDPVFLQRILDWYSETQTQLKPVGSIYRNLYGLWDMHGLIWEWVDDFNSSFVTGESREDSSFNKNLFCGAGGMNGANKEDYAAFMRFAFRSSLKGRSSVWNLGFRCVK